MKPPQATRWISWGVGAALLASIAGCGGSSSIEPGAGTTGALPTVTPTPHQSSSSVTGLVVLRNDVSPGAPDALGVPPPDWGETADQGSFDRAFANADWTVVGVDGQRGATSERGNFQVSNLPPGRYTIQLTKTLDGNLVPLTIPLVVGDDGSATLVAEVGLGLVRTTLTYVQGGKPVREVRGPYGNWLIIRDGRVAEIGDGSRVLTDSNGDGQLDNPNCTQDPWSCGTDMADPNCGPERFCQCVAACPFCDNCELPGVCVSKGTAPPYHCNTDDTCTLPGDRCVCVPSCPTCNDCSTKVCASTCAPLEITAINVSGPTQLVVGRQAQAYATAQLSDGSVFDVTYLADWQSSDETIATVDSWGHVSATAIGTTNLTASVGTVHSSPTLLSVVERPTLSAIHVQNPGCFCGPTELAQPAAAGDSPVPCLLPAAPPTADVLPVPACNQLIVIGATLQLTALGEYADGSYEDITKDVRWQVMPPSVANVVNGLLTAEQAGAATVTASLAATTSDPVSVKVVTEPTLESLSIYPGDSGVRAVPGAPGVEGDALPSPCFECGVGITVLRGDQLQFQATAHYDTGEWRDVTAQVTWRTTNAAAATIEATGAMHAVQGGDAVIDAGLDSVTSNPVDVHVVNEATLQSIYIYQEGNDRVVAKGDQRFLHANGSYDIGINRDVTAEATWRSSNDAVGEFDTPGVFTGRSAGQVQVWAELGGQVGNQVPLEVFETSELAYCDPANVNRGVWSDAFNRVLLESDCATYTQPGVATLRYTVTETQPHGGVFDPCLDLYVFQGEKKIRTIREEGCGDPFLPAAAPGRDEAAVAYQLRAFWDLKDDSGAPVVPGPYTIYGRFYLYYDPVVSIGVTVTSPDGTVPTPTPRPTPPPMCTPPVCATGEAPSCGTANGCPSGCGFVCAKPTPNPNRGVIIRLGSATGMAGQSIAIDVSMQTGGTAVAGAQNDIVFDPQLTFDQTDNGRPQCKVNPSINKPQTAFSFLPAGCQPGVDCTRLRAIVVSIDDVAPIPDGVLLYSCSVTIPDMGTYALHCDGATASTPDGHAVEVHCIDGAVQAINVTNPPPPPENDGACFVGSAMCDSASFLTTIQAKCCDLYRFGGMAPALSWCPKDQLDPMTGKCIACASSPCDGLPPIPMQ